jgi:hypothetical protein
MAPSEMNRRDFQKLAAAAMGGVLAGTAVGCGDKPAPKAPVEEKPKEVAVVAELHVCRGLNSCKGQGKDGKNACAGQGTCATAKAHDCGGMNECKGQGACGEKPGDNDCKGMGGCHVPVVSKVMWKQAREHFAEKMKKAGKTIGEAPVAEKPKEDAPKDEKKE